MKKNLLIASSADSNLISSLDRIQKKPKVWVCGSHFTEQVNNSFPDCVVIENDNIFKLCNSNSNYKQLNIFSEINKHLFHLLNIASRYEYKKISVWELTALSEKIVKFYMHILDSHKIRTVLLMNSPHTIDGYCLFIAANISLSNVYITKVTSLTGVLKFEKMIFNGDDYRVWNDENFKIAKEDSEASEIESKLIQYKNNIISNNAKPDNHYRIIKKYQTNKIVKKFIVSFKLIFIIASIVISKLKGRDYVNKHRLMAKYKNIPWGTVDGLPIINAIYYFAREFDKIRLRKEYISFYNKNCKSLNNIDKFIYVPMQYQPENTTTPLGGQYSHFLNLARKIRAILPSDYYIVMKEHPYQFNYSFSMGVLGRDIETYKALLEIDKLLFVPSEMQSNEIIRSSKGVAVITSSVGFEALCHGKPLLVFGYPWWYVNSEVCHINSKDGDEKFIEDIQKNDYKFNFDAYIDKLSTHLFRGDFADLNSAVEMSPAILEYFNQK